MTIDKLRPQPMIREETLPYYFWAFKGIKEHQQVKVCALIMITQFFKRKTTGPEGDEDINNNSSSPTDTNVSKRKCTITASLKTVKKWEQEFQIPIGYTKDGDAVTTIWCSICEKFATDRSSSLVSGCNRVKKESIVYHVKSSTHHRAVAAKLAFALKENQKVTPIEKGFQKSDEQTLLKMDKLMRTVFYLVKKERPFSDFCDLLDLQNLNGLEIGHTYFSDKAAKEFASHIAEMYFDEMKELLHTADYFSVFCDGSTDRSETEKEIVMIKILKGYYPVMMFLSLEEPPNGKALGIVAALDNAFAKFGIQNWKQKLIGFCSDGASVNFGEVRGVSTLLKAQSPWIISVWCLAHRLELAVKDAFKSTYMDSVIEVITSIYYFYRGSSKRNREAQELADIMDEHFLKPKKANGTRWVEHKLQAVSKMLKNWPIIVSHLNNYSEDNTNRGEDRAKAKGILKKLCQYKLVYYLYFTKDVLSEVSRISLLFQREDITVSSAVTILQCVNSILNDMVQNPGIHLAKFPTDVNGTKFHGKTLHNQVDIQTLHKQKRQLIISILDCIQSRFENLHQNPLFTACHVFDHKNWPEMNADDALVNYGTAEIQRLVGQFRPLLGNCDTDAALREWTYLKAHVVRNQHFVGVHPLAVFQRICLEDQDTGTYKNIMTIIHLASLFPLSNASCERGFSTMKRIKSDWRCNLNNETMNILMRIDMCGKKLEDFEPRPVVNRWWISGMRVKRPNIAPYGPHQ